MKIILDTDEAAALLFLPPEMLAQWRRAGVGPKHFRTNGRILYRIEDVLAWLRTAAADQSGSQRVAREVRR